MSEPRWEVFEDKAGEWRFRLIGANGEPMLASESYGSERDAERGAQAAYEAALETGPSAADQAEDAAFEAGAESAGGPADPGLR